MKYYYLNFYVVLYGLHNEVLGGLNCMMKKIKYFKSFIKVYCKNWFSKILFKGF